MQVILNQPGRVHGTEHPERRAQYGQRRLVSHWQRSNALPGFGQTLRIVKIGGQQNMPSRWKVAGQNQIWRQYSGLTQGIDPGFLLGPMPRAVAIDKKLDQDVPAVPFALADNPLGG